MGVVEGITINGKTPLIVGTYSGRLVIMGDGWNVWDDYNEISKRWGIFDVMAVNQIAIYKHNIKHFVYLHDFVETCVLGHRDALVKGGACNKSINHYKYLEGRADYGWDIWPRQGTVSMFAAKIAVCLGYDEIMLCGCPMDGQKHFYDNPENVPDLIKTEVDAGAVCRAEALPDQMEYWKTARRDIPAFRRRVRSMSGNTKEVLGGTHDK